jgi:hypothetical protein
MWRSRPGPTRREEPPAPPVDGKVVGRAIKDSIRPLLKASGFTIHTDRKAWRPTEYTVDHVTFRSFNSYMAGALGCTTYSFTVEVGTFYRCFDTTLERPQDYHCTFRAILGKTIEQPFFVTEWGPAQDRPDVYYVLPDGSNLDAVVTDAKEVLVQQGLTFLDRYNDPARAFDVLMSERMTDGDFGQPQVMLPGNPDSPAWQQAALRIGHLVMDNPRAAMRAAPVLRQG